MIGRGMALAALLGMAAEALADCPVDPAPAPRVVFASAQAKAHPVPHFALHRVRTMMTVPVHIHLEVRYLLSEIPEKRPDGIAPWLDKVGDDISARERRMVKERFGVDVDMNTNVGFELTGPAAIARLESQGFRLAETRDVPHEGRTVKASVWVKGVPLKMDKRAVDSQAVRSQATVSITPNPCIDDRQGLLGFAPAVQVIDRGAQVHPGAEVADGERAALHLAFLREAREEANRFEAWLREYRHPVPGDVGAGIAAKKGESFPVKVPFTLFGKPGELLVEVTSVPGGVLDAPLGSTSR